MTTAIRALPPLCLTDLMVAISDVPLNKKLNMAIEHDGHGLIE